MSIEKHNINEKEYPQLFFAGAKGMLAWVVLSLVLTFVGYLLETLLSDGGITMLASDILAVIAKILIVAVSIAAYVTVMASGYCDGHTPIYRRKDPERK